MIGIPLRIIIGKDAVQGRVESVERKSGLKEIITVEAAYERIFKRARLAKPAD